METVKQSFLLKRWRPWCSFQLLHCVKLLQEKLDPEQLAKLLLSQVVILQEGVRPHPYWRSHHGWCDPMVLYPRAAALCLGTGYLWTCGWWVASCGGGDADSEATVPWEGRNWSDQLDIYGTEDPPSEKIEAGCKKTSLQSRRWPPPSTPVTSSTLTRASTCDLLPRVQGQLRRLLQAEYFHEMLPPHPIGSLMFPYGPPRASNRVKVGTSLKSPWGRPGLHMAGWQSPKTRGPQLQVSASSSSSEVQRGPQADPGSTSWWGPDKTRGWCWKQTQILSWVNTPDACQCWGGIIDSWAAGLVWFPTFHFYFILACKSVN